jgi:hypothetical protein
MGVGVVEATFRGGSFNLVISVSREMHSLYISSLSNAVLDQVAESQIFTSL